MKRQWIVLTTLATVCVLTAAAPGQQVGRSQVAGQLHEKIEELHALRHQRLEDQKAAEQKSAALDGQVERLKADLAALEPTVKAQRDAVAAIESRLADQRAATAESSTTLNQAAEALAGTAAAMRDRIAAGIPYRREERAARFTQLVTALRGADPVARNAALTDFWPAVADELRLANSTQLWNEPVLVDNGQRQVQAYQLRIGMVNQLFISEDGQASGRASLKPDAAWLVESPDAVTRLIFAVARQQKPSQLTAIPFPLRAAGGRP